MITLKKPTVLQFVDKYLITRFGSCFNQAGCDKIVTEPSCLQALISEELSVFITIC